MLAAVGTELTAVDTCFAGLIWTTAIAAAALAVNLLQALSSRPKGEISPIDMVLRDI